LGFLPSEENAKRVLKIKPPKLLVLKYDRDGIQIARRPRRIYF